MTALDLASATRSFIAPTETFESLNFGTSIIAPLDGPHPVAVDSSGRTYIPRNPDVPGVSILWGDTTLATNVTSAVFIAVRGPIDPTDTEWSVFTGPTCRGGLTLRQTKLRIAAIHSNSVLPIDTVLATPNDDQVVVYAMVNNSSQAFVATSRDGVLGTGAKVTGTISATRWSSYPGISANGGAGIYGCWQFDGVSVSQADALDTMAAIIAALPTDGAATGTFVATGSWGIAGTSTIDGDASGEDDPLVYDEPAAGGAQEAPEPPAFDLPDGPAQIRHVWATYDAPTALAGTQPSPVDWQASAAAATDYGHVQIVVEGVDITTIDGVRTPLPRRRRGEPFGCYNARIELPTINTFSAPPAWCRQGANVSVRMHKIAGGVVSLFEGVIVTPGLVEDAAKYGVECRGVIHVADRQLRKPTTSTKPVDVGTALAKALNAAVGRRFGKLASVVTGVSTSVAGGWEPLATGYAQKILATALDREGRQWTIACPERTPTLVKKDLTTAHYTIRSGQPGIDVSLESNGEQALTTIYGEGVAPDGGRWGNWKYPNWHPDDTPTYPFEDAGTTIRVGVRDSDTDTGDGVSVWQAKTGQPVTGIFSTSDRSALMRLQSDAGILVDGYLGPQSWASTFDTGANTGSLDGAYPAPLASLRAVEPHLVGPDGDRLGANPAFDPGVLRIEDKIDYGQGVTRAVARRDAARRLKRDSRPGWYGTVTFHLDPAEKSRLEIREGENIRILGHQGQTLLTHIASVDDSGEDSGNVITCHVDTNARDYPTLAALVERDRNATDPAKAAIKRLLDGSIGSDHATYDAESPAGRMPRHPVFSNLWDVRRIPMGSYGRIVRTVFTTTAGATPFALAVFGKPITAAQLLGIAGNPLTAEDNPWNEHADALEEFGLLQAYGWTKQPAGYYPGTYTDPDGETAAPVTGRLVDDASWDYATESSPWLYVATIASSSCYVEGRFYGAPSN